MVYYMVQLEVFSQGDWKPVIRYDHAHGYSHVDRYNLAGEVMKEKIELEFAEALTAAEDDIEQNWRVYLERFLEGRCP